MFVRLVKIRSSGRRPIDKNKVRQALGRLVTINVLQAEGRSNLFVLFNSGEREMKFKKLLKKNEHIMGCIGTV